jgi:hypothetical protein
LLKEIEQYLILKSEFIGLKTSEWMERTPFNHTITKR